MRMIVLLLSLCFSTCSFAQSSLWIKSSAVIQNLKSVLATTRKSTGVPVLFPKVILRDPNHTKLYAYFDPNAHKAQRNYRITVDFSADCEGVKTCNLGEMSAELGGKHQVHYALTRHPLTVSVKLKKGIKGYFTPGHAGGDYWPAQIVWKYRNVLYRLRWRLHPDTEKAVLIKMANSTLSLFS